MTVAAQFTRVTDNFINVSVSSAVTADTHLVMDGQRYSFFRMGKKPGSYYYIKGKPADLTHSDIAAINRTLDTREGSRNRAVKNNLAQALHRHFNERSLHVTEFGSGQRPIHSYLPPDMNITFHAVDCDPACVHSLQKMNIPSSGWEGAIKKGIPSGKPALGVSVYALHFMVNNELPGHIRALVSDDGFFAGNFYVDSAERESGEQRRKLGRLLHDSGMSYAVLRHPGPSSNEYWIVSRTQDIGPAEGFAVTLRDTIAAMRGKLLEIVSRPAPSLPA